MKKYSLFFFLFFAVFAFSQEEEKPKKWALNGYVKDLQTLSILSIPNPITGELINTTIQDNLIHNRLNFSWFPNENFRLKFELRNRFFWGDQIRFSGATLFKENLNAGNDYFDLDLAAVDSSGIGIHSIIDRFYGEYVKGKWEIRLGRQRINWGINTVWNPNDIFNAYSFTDFDYQERPGSDALRIRYYIGYVGSFEIASKVFENWEEATLAALWKFNKWNYDIQFLFGLAEGDYAFGGGWAGNLKNIGFKGEFTYFLPFEKGAKESFSATFSADYIFKNGLFLNLGLLYNSNGTTDGSITELFDFDLSSKNLYPYEYAIFFAGNASITPLLTSGLSIIYSPSKAHALFLNPTVSYSIKENWDVDFVGQFVFDKEGDLAYRSPVQALFLRFKYSF